MLLKEIMTTDVITVSPENTLKDVGRLLKAKRISGIPVIENDMIAGIITITDIMKVIEEIYRWQELEKKATGLKISDLVGKEKLNSKVGSIMTKTVFTLEEDKTVDDAVQLMFKKKVHTIPVTRNGKLAGVIGKRDLVCACL
jgi:CBS domain-containing protein